MEKAEKVELTIMVLAEREDPELVLVVKVETIATKLITVKMAEMV